MTIVTLIGSLAALCSTLSFVPQAWKIIRTRRTDGLSAHMYAVTVAGFSLWLAYGVMLGEWPLIATNAICLSLSAFILAMPILPQRKKEAVADLLDPRLSPGALQEIERALPGCLRVRLVVIRSGRVGEGVIGVVPVDRQRLAGLLHRLLEAGDHLVIDELVLLAEMAEHGPLRPAARPWRSAAACRNR